MAFVPVHGDYEPWENFMLVDARAPIRRVQVPRFLCELSRAKRFLEWASTNAPYMVGFARTKVQTIAFAFKANFPGHGRRRCQDAAWRRKRRRRQAAGRVPLPSVG